MTFVQSFRGRTAWLACFMAASMVKICSWDSVQKPPQDAEMEQVKRAKPPLHHFR